MYVCICNGVTERTVREAAADGVHTMAELTRRTGCASTCGGCADYAEEVLRNAYARVAFPLPLLVAA